MRVARVTWIVLWPIIPGAYKPYLYNLSGSDSLGSRRLVALDVDLGGALGGAGSSLAFKHKTPGACERALVLLDV